MKAAIVERAGQSPVYKEIEAPKSEADEVLVQVRAAAISQVVKSRASGTHYSSSGQFPFVVGVDGVGRLEDGRRVYFALPRAPFGSMAELAVVAASHCLPIPDDLDDVTAAAIANPGMSAWAALWKRAKFIPGETVLINGATGTAGRLAVQIAKYLGAKKVIATGRNVEALKDIASFGADMTIPLGGRDDMVECLKEPFSQGIDVVLDYLWGSSAEAILTAAALAGPEMIPIRFVQVGSISGSSIALPSAALRSSAIELMGSGIGSVSFDQWLDCIHHLFAATTAGGFKIITKTAPLSKVAEAWNLDESGTRTVLTVDWPD